MKYQWIWFISPLLPSRQMSNSNQLQMCCCLIISEAVFTLFTSYRAAAHCLMGLWHQWLRTFFCNFDCSVCCLGASWSQDGRVLVMNRTLLPVTQCWPGAYVPCDQDSGAQMSRLTVSGIAQNPQLATGLSSQQTESDLVKLWDISQLLCKVYQPQRGPWD